MIDPVVSPEWLKQRLGDGRTKIVDASWYMPDTGRDAAEEFEAGHIPGAVRFDIDEIAEQASGLPHTLASPHAFAAAAGRLGLSETDTIVVYDGLGLFSAPRVWWNFRIMGARSTLVLDGGFPAWRAAGGPIERGRANPRPATFEPTFKEGAIHDLNRVASFDGGTIVDARAKDRFLGVAREPRPGMRSGHIPGSRNLPFTALQRDGRLLPADELREAFDSGGIDPSSDIVATCGSGVTAAVIILALERLSHGLNAIYDGSWSEWGGRDDTPVATGAAA